MELHATGNHIPYQNGEHHLIFSIIRIALGQLGTCSKGNTGTAVSLTQGNTNIVDAWHLAATSAAHTLCTAKNFHIPLIQLGRYKNRTRQKCTQRSRSRTTSVATYRSRHPGSKGHQLAWVRGDFCSMQEVPGTVRRHFAGRIALCHRHSLKSNKG